MVVRKELPTKMIKGSSSFTRTKYGSYIPDDMDGMAAEKNARSHRELSAAGYWPPWGEMTYSEQELYTARDKASRQSYRDFHR